MDYNQKPWLNHYDPGVPEWVDLPVSTMISEFDSIVNRFGRQPAFWLFGLEMTFNDLHSQASGFARRLEEFGCKPGDVVGIGLPNTPQFLIALLGAFKAGCVVSGVSPLLSPSELVYQLNDCRARVFVTLDAVFERKFAAVADQTPDVEVVIASGIVDYLPWLKRTLARYVKRVPHGRLHPLTGKEVLHFRDFIAGSAPGAMNPTIEPDNPCLIQYTGGTTGLPKGTLLTHRNMTANLHQIAAWVRPAYGNERLLSGFPLFHQAGLALCLAALFMGGGQILIPDPRNTRHIANEIRTYRPTMMVNVPSLYMMLIEEPAFRKLDFSNLGFCLSGASPFPVESIGQLESLVGDGKVLEVYGMTETSPIITMNPRHGEKRAGTVGLPISSTQVCLVDLETRERPVPVGEEGELIVRGPQVMTGYLNRPDETRIALRDHDGDLWLHTGDVARMGPEGYVSIVDRAKDMLTVGGFKVFSRVVEEKLYEHPMIDFCAIVGLPNRDRPGTEIVKLVVQPGAAYRETDPEAVKADLLQFCKRTFSPYKVPKIVEIVDHIPLTAVGKVDKKALR